MDDKQKIRDVTQQSFIRSASTHFLASMLKSDANQEDLVRRSVNLAFALNEELTKRFEQ